MLLHEYLSRAAGEAPEKVALVSGSARVTYRTLNEGASSFAAYLVRNGLRRGDRVGVYIDSSPESVMAIFGVFLAGGCVVVVNPATPAERLGYILNNCGASFLVASPAKAAAVTQALTACDAAPKTIWAGGSAPGDGGASFEGIVAGRSPAPSVRLIDADLAAIIYTSGSTGRPKGVTHLHRSINTAVDAVAEYLDNNRDDVILNVLPSRPATASCRSW